MAMLQDESLTETLSIEDGLQLLPECGQGGCSSHRRGVTVLSDQSETIAVSPVHYSGRLH